MRDEYDVSHGATVKRAVKIGGEDYRPGDEVDADAFEGMRRRNVEALVNAGFITPREPGEAKGAARKSQGRKKTPRLQRQSA